ncbi:MAG: glycosyltransferase family 39 protein [Thermoflexales bacterium]|nr:glycosyltransferase family 39 protein [Thermoflexales bacterium]
MNLIRRYLWFYVVPVFLLLTLFGILITGARALSLTTDEPLHVAIGYAILARGKAAFWLLPTHGHPPLLNVLEATLLYLEKPDIPLEQFPGWIENDYTKYTQAFILQLVPTERIELISRFPIILTTLILAGLVYRWGKELWGNRAGLIALFALCFDPNLLAHGRLATTDVGTAALGTFALYFTWRWMLSPSWKKSLAIGVWTGLTVLAKMNGLIWLAAIGLLMVFRAFKEPTRHCVALLAQGMSATALSLLMLWAGHGFSWGPVQGLPGKYPVPEFWNGLILQAEFGKHLLTFAWGTIEMGPRWWYFPLAFFIKNPVPLLCALGIAVAIFLHRPISFSRNRFVNVMVFPVLYILVAVTGSINIGYRHLLPIHPIIYLIIGGGLNWLWGKESNNVWKLGLMALSMWYVGTTLRIFPYEIAYFNEVAGGPYNGHHYLVDSNLDWGQSIKALRRWLNDHREWQKEPLYVIGSNPALYTLYGIPSHSYRWVGSSLLYARFAPPIWNSCYRSLRSSGDRCRRAG